MKPVVAKLVVLFVVMSVLLTGCGGKNTPNNTGLIAPGTMQPAKPSDFQQIGHVNADDPYWDELRDYMDVNDVLVGDLTEEEQEELQRLAEEKSAKGYWQSAVIKMSLKLGNAPKTVYRAVRLANEYNLDWTLPSPNNGRVAGELTLADLERLREMEWEVEKELRKKPYEERMMLPYRTYEDMIEHGDPMEPIIVYFSVTKQAPYIWAVEGNWAAEDEIYFYTVPELITMNLTGTYTVPGILVVRWNKDLPGNLPQRLGDKAGDGNFYKHYVHLIWDYDTKNLELRNMKTFLYLEDEELTTNLGPNWVEFDYDVVAEKPTN